MQVTYTTNVTYIKRIFNFEFFTFFLTLRILRGYVFNFSRKLITESTHAKIP